MNAFDINNWDNEFIDKHRRGISDLDWARQQPYESPKYKIGDRVEFKVGGFGVIHKVKLPQSGWPSSYATEDIEGFKGHPKTKRAWHYEGDFKDQYYGQP